MKRSDTEDKATREALDSFLTADDEAAIVIAAATMGDAEKRGIRLHTSHASAIDLIGFAFAALSNAHGTLKAAGSNPPTSHRSNRRSSCCSADRERPERKR